MDQLSLAKSFFCIFGSLLNHIGDSWAGRFPPEISRSWSTVMTFADIKEDSPDF
ncbi:hypothetical protein NY10_1694 [Carnobacterium antarcticum]|nr:hypothetical protein NY10_1694 [Carnobacterium sp. CP1]